MFKITIYSAIVLLIVPHTSASTTTANKDPCDMVGWPKWNAHLREARVPTIKAQYFKQKTAAPSFSLHSTDTIFCRDNKALEVCKNLDDDAIKVLQAAQLVSAADFEWSSIPQRELTDTSTRESVWKCAVVAFKSLQCDTHMLAERITDHLFQFTMDHLDAKGDASKRRLSRKKMAEVRKSGLSVDYLESIRHLGKETVTEILVEHLTSIRNILTSPSPLLPSDFKPKFEASLDNINLDDTSTVYSIRELCRSSEDCPEMFGPNLFDEYSEKWSAFCGKVNDGACIGLVEEFDGELEAKIAGMKWSGVEDFARNDLIMAKLEDRFLFMVSQCEKGLICPVCEGKEPAQNKNQQKNVKKKEKKSWFG